MSRRPPRLAKAYTPRGAFLASAPPRAGDGRQRERVRDRVRARRRLAAKRAGDK